MPVTSEIDLPESQSSQNDSIDIQPVTKIESNMITYKRDTSTLPTLIAIQSLPINKIIERIRAQIPNTNYMEKSLKICTKTFDTIFKMSRNPFYTYVDYLERHITSSWSPLKTMDFDVLLHNYRDLSNATFALCSFICLKNIGDFSFNNDDPLQSDDSVGGFISLLLQTVTNWNYSNASSKVETADKNILSKQRFIPRFTERINPYVVVLENDYLSKQIKNEIISQMPKVQKLENREYEYNNMWYIMVNMLRVFTIGAEINFFKEPFNIYTNALTTDDTNVLRSDTI